MRSLIQSRWSGLVFLGLVIGAICAIIGAAQWRKEAEVNEYVAKLDYLASHPEVQETQLAIIPIGQMFDRRNLELYILHSIGHTFDLSELAQVTIQPGSPHDGRRVFVFEADTNLVYDGKASFWRRVQ